MVMDTHVFLYFRVNQIKLIMAFCHRPLKGTLITKRFESPIANPYAPSFQFQYLRNKWEKNGQQTIFSKALSSPPPMNRPVMVYLLIFS